MQRGPFGILNRKGLTVAAFCATISQPNSSPELHWPTEDELQDADNEPFPPNIALRTLKLGLIKQSSPGPAPPLRPVVLPRRAAFSTTDTLQDLRPPLVKQQAATASLARMAGKKDVN